MKPAQFQRAPRIQLIAKIAAGAVAVVVFGQNPGTCATVAARYFASLNASIIFVDIRIKRPAQLGVCFRNARIGTVKQLIPGCRGDVIVKRRKPFVAALKVATDHTITAITEIP